MKAKLKIGGFYKVKSVRADGTINEGALDTGVVRVSKIDGGVVTVQHQEHKRWYPKFQATELGYKFIPGPDDELGDPNDEPAAFVFVPVEEPEYVVSWTSTVNGERRSVRGDYMSCAAVYGIMQFANVAPKCEFEVA